MSAERTHDPSLEVQPGSAATEDDSKIVLPAPSSIRPGDVVDRYTILEPLGSGGMGVVYAASDPRLERKIALKLLRPGEDARSDARRSQRLLREAQAIARLSHPNVIEVLNAGTVDGRVFLAMEYVDGKTLTDWLNEAHTRQEIVAVLIAAGKGIQAIHDAGLVHRDIKPDNIMIGADGRVRVMDLGLARLEGDGSGHGGASNVNRFEDRLTHDGAVLGTVGYIAPEAYAGAVVQAPADQFSYCVVVYEALMGRRPHAGDEPQTIAAAVVEGKVVPFASSLPARMRRAILRGLAVDPKQRWPTMASLIAELEVANRRPRVALWLSGGVVATAAIAFVALTPPPERCAGATSKADAIWGDPQRNRVATAMRAAGAEFGETTASKTVETIDNYLGHWRALRTDVCETYGGSAAQSQRIVERAIACLDDRLQRVHALVEVLSEPDPTVARRAAFAANALPKLAPCSDATALQEDALLDPMAAAELDELRPRLDQVETMRLAGKPADAWAVLDEVERDARLPRYPSQHARALQERANLLREAGRIPEAIESLRAGYTVAAALRERSSAALAAIALAELSTESGDLEEGRRWLRAATADLTAAGTVDEDRGHLSLVEAQLLHATGDLAGAVERTNEGLALVDADDPFLMARLKVELSALQHDRGQFAAAEDAGNDALAIYTRELGTQHPTTALTQLNLCAVERVRGRVTAADQCVADALTLLSTIAGDADRAEAEALINVVDGLLELGDHERALDVALRAEVAYTAVSGPGSLGVGWALDRQSRAFATVGRAAEAIEAATRGLAIVEASVGVDSPQISRLLLTLAYAHEIAGDEESSAMHLERAAALTEGAGGMGYALTQARLAFLYRKRGQHAKAVAAADIALKLGTAMLDAHDVRLCPIYVTAAESSITLGHVEQGAQYHAHCLAAFAELPREDGTTPEDLAIALRVVLRMAASTGPARTLEVLDGAARRVAASNAPGAAELSAQLMEGADSLRAPPLPRVPSRSERREWYPGDR